MRPERPINETLYEALRVYSRRVAGCDASSVTIRFADGSSQTIEIPPYFFRGHHRASPRPLEDEGDGPAWSFPTSGDPTYRGNPVRVAGKARKLLKCLAQAEVPLSVERLLRDVWDEAAEERTAVNAVSALRKVLREELELGETDPISSDEDGYRLLLD